MNIFAFAEIRSYRGAPGQGGDSARSACNVQRDHFPEGPRPRPACSACKGCANSRVPGDWRDSTNKQRISLTWTGLGAGRIGYRRTSRGTAIWRNHVSPRDASDAGGADRTGRTPRGPTAACSSESAPSARCWRQEALLLTPGYLVAAPPSQSLARTAWNSPWGPGGGHAFGLAKSPRPEPRD